MLEYYHGLEKSEAHYVGVEVASNTVLSSMTRKNHQAKVTWLSYFIPG